MEGPLPPSCDQMTLYIAREWAASFAFYFHVNSKTIIVIQNVVFCAMAMSAFISARFMCIERGMQIFTSKQLGFIVDSNYKVYDFILKVYIFHVIFH